MDETQPLLERLEKVKIIHNTHNIGFLHACNQAAKVARGDTLLFLNNDAQLLPGSLSSALTSLTSSTTVGAVGGKIILLDGSLQEAGSIVWSDGSCSGYGRGDSPLAPMYMFRRNVDYCSGAFLLTRRQHFNELGGFDIDFAPAYYEETDYCFRLRQRGLLTIYDPNAVIIHYEFGSASLPDQGIKQQAINQNIFVEKHRNTLAKNYSNSQENVLHARQATKPKYHVLFIDDRVPHQGLGQGFPRANSILSLLFEFDLFVTIYPLGFPIEDWPSVYSDLPREVEVMIGHGLDKFRSFLQDRRGYYDIFFISRPHNMRLVQEIRKEQPALFDGVKIIYDAEAIFAAREILRAEIFDKSFSIMEKQKLIHSELEIASNVDAVITVSEMECSYFKDFGIINTYVLGHALIPKPTTNSFAARRNILFVGAITDNLSPNADSIIWFVNEVFPRIRRILGDDVNLLIAGSNKSAKVDALQCSNVKILGFIEDLYSLYNTSRIFIVPTRFAGGIPYKAHEAAAHGLPIVASTLIASQLDWKSGEDLLAAPTDNPVEFANQCIKLYSDPILWQNLRENSLRRIELECSPQAFRQTLRYIMSIDNH
jgi:glycosyltransferase involved in cell wall biosynthesis